MYSIEASILVDAPVAECYRRWRDFARFPELFSRVVRVARVETAVRDEREVWHWVVQGPFGQLFEWCAEVVLELPNKTISWASVSDKTSRGDLVATSGSVNFLQPSGGEQTLIEVRMTYAAPQFQEMLADIIHYGNKAVHQALQGFKNAMEQKSVLISCE